MAYQYLGDWDLALTLLGNIPSVFPLSTKKDEHPLPDQSKGHMLITTVAITPYRGIWSQSKCPGAAKINFHLLDEAPGLVIPVRNNAPLVSWCGITVDKMRNEWKFSKETDCGTNHWSKALYEFVETYLDKERVQPHWEKRLKIGVEIIMRSWTRDAIANGAWMKGVELNRAGIVMLYY